MREGSLLQLPGRCEQFVPSFRFSFWFDRHHIASPSSLDVLCHVLHCLLQFGGNRTEKAGCREQQDAVCVFFFFFKQKTAYEMALGTWLSSLRMARRLKSPPYLASGCSISWK